MLNISNGRVRTFIIVIALLSMALALSGAFAVRAVWAAPSTTDCSSVTEIPVAECNELVAFYDDAGGNNWTNNNGWKQTNTPCSWYGVYCESGHVHTLDLPNNNLDGSLRDVNLPELTRLNLGSNHLAGNIPNFSHTLHLKTLYLYSNQFTGTIPNFSLSELERLYLEDNQLSGSLPFFSGIPNVQFLYLYSNQLTGSIPAFPTQNLLELNLSQNQLSSSIPSFDLPKLQKMDLSENNLNGEIPDFDLPELVELYLAVNHLQGPLPAFSHLSKLQDINIFSNDVDGTIPNFLLYQLLHLDLSYNQLSGPLPNLINLSHLQDLDISDNGANLTGSIPDFVLPDLVHLDLSHNALGGSLPGFTSLNDLETMDLSYNQLQGPLPDYSNANLDELNLSHNQLNTTIPDFSHITMLRSLDISYNQMVGSIPPFTYLSDLQTLDLSHNYLGNTIPDFANKANFQSIDLSYNRLEGALPWMANFSSLTTLSVAYNQLGGDLGASGVCSTPLVTTDFAYNKFDIASIDACVDNLDADWKDTQTAPPSNIHPSAISGKKIDLTWDAIPYTWDGGFYEAFASTTAGGPYTSKGNTGSKSDTAMAISGFTPGNTYYIVMNTFTPAHDDQQNALTSSYSDEHIAMMVAIDTNGNDVTLSWTPASAFEQYEVLYSADPYFQPTDAGVTSVTTSSDHWTHYGVASDAAHNYFYLMRGIYSIFANTKSNVFNRTGEFTFALTPGS
ncbi:MAG: hypothetical protein DSY55_05000 [Clostridia bacterium]|nr:MAG: hypothetical protein DSY55_05000 [Clostridia bacterium]